MKKLCLLSFAISLLLQTAYAQFNYTWNTSTVNICEGNSATLTLSGVSGQSCVAINITYSLYLQGGGLVATNNTGSFTIAPPQGSYMYYVVISGTGTCGNETTTDVAVNVTPKPSVPTGLTASPNTLCTGNTLTLSATGSNLSWKGPAGYTANGSPVTRPSLTTNHAGTYNVKQTANGCTSDSATITVFVNQVANITSVTPTSTSTCGGSNGSLTISGTANTIVSNTNYSVTYTKNNGTPTNATIQSSGAGTITITGLTAGSYKDISISLSSATICTSNVFAGPVTVSDPAPPAAPSNVIATPNPICTNNSLTLSANGSNLSWTGPGGFTANGSSVTRSITSTTQGGTYSVTQTVNNCVSSAATVSVTVYQTPAIGNVNPSNPSTCGGTNGNLVLTGLASNSTYSISYTRNGATVGPTNLNTNGAGTINISGLSAGSYANITATINGCPSAPVSGPIVLSDPSTPAAPTNVAANLTTICTGDILSLTATGSNLSWTGPSSYSATGSPATRTIALGHGGVYNVTQTVNNCTSLPASVTITVNPTPVTVNSPQATICGGTKLNIALASQPTGADFVWKAIGTPGNISGYSTTNVNTNTINDSLVNNSQANGLVIYSITPTLTGCTGNISFDTVLVNPKPNAQITVTSADKQCESLNSFSFQATTQSIITNYNWNVNAGLTPSNFSGATANNLHFVGNGNSTVTLQVTTAAGCIDTATYAITVYPNPSVSVSTPANIVCSGSQVNINSSVSPAGNISYLWSPNSETSQGLSFVGNAQSLTLPSVTTYTLIITDGNLCKDTAALQITVNPTPTKPVIDDSKNLTYCAGSLAQDFFVTNWEDVNYAWNSLPTSIHIIGANASACKIDVPNIVNSNFSVIVKAENTYGCSNSDTAKVTITANTAPTATIIKNQNTLICSNNTADSYQWGYTSGTTMQDSAISGETLSDYMPGTDPDSAVSHKYFWVIIKQGSCESKVYYQSPNWGLTDMEQVALFNEIKVYPNPVTNTLQVAIEPGVEVLQSEIRDLSGRLVFGANLNGGVNYTIQTAQWSAGVYFIRFTHPSGYSHTVKLVKQ